MFPEQRPRLNTIFYIPSFFATNQHRNVLPKQPSGFYPLEGQSLEGKGSISHVVIHRGTRPASHCFQTSPFTGEDTDADAEGQLAGVPLLGLHAHHEVSLRFSWGAGPEHDLPSWILSVAPGLQA